MLGKSGEATSASKGDCKRSKHLQEVNKTKKGILLALLIEVFRRCLKSGATHGLIINYVTHSTPQFIKELTDECFV